MQDSSTAIGIGLMFGAPFLAFAVNMIGVLDLSIKDTRASLQNVTDLIQKQKIEALSTIIESSSSSTPGIGVSQDLLKAVCYKVDRIVYIEGLKRICQDSLMVYQWTLYSLMIGSFILFISMLTNKSVQTFINNFALSITVLELFILLLVMGSLMFAKNKVLNEYDKEYKI